MRKLSKSRSFVGALFGSLALGACTNNAPQQSFIPSFSEFQSINVIQTSPENAATGVPLDTDFSIILDEKVDAYSAIPENFEIFNSSGDRVGAKLVSTKFVQHPQDPNRVVSKISVALPGGVYLLPNNTYTFHWGETNPEIITGENANAFGIQSIYLAPLRAGSVEFTTGDQFINRPGSSNHLEVLSMSPGRALGRGSSFEFNASLGDVFNRSGSSSYLTVRPKSEIRIHFSEPIVDLGSEYSLETNGFSELPPTPIDQFGHMGVFTFSKDIKFSDVFIDAADSTYNQWINFRNSLSNRLRGKVRTENGRRTLIFELDPSCEPTSLCQYPEWPGSVVVVVLRDLRSWQTEKTLVDNTYISGFIHFPGFRFDSGVIFDSIFGNAGGSGL
ncbi:MAG: hypothetical protein ACO3LE_08895 [Bdellovibrionota bacterium]